ncbi:MBL fold metallo-hydrolase [Saccharothrix violaceirubra]|uniref:Ribonuclease BN (tRNA processing enzyme) n=1 Tax=Saccharothrix violaceirubra TaxID=413306 RepID=A0A7W7WYL6_9PSEU|nr:MBL fold metallo-hydrolase [Saccharothrix violaceirubra]MBB4968116.1 ribonuclease BN (tRNA processing enzyme) [Saccharothrix violaceirubra]
MLLTILGCSGSLPGPDAPSSGYLVEADGFSLAVDFGSGVLAALQAHRDPFALGAVLFSHLHPDHCGDFSGLTVLRRYHPDPPYDPTTRPLPVYGPGESPDRFARAYAESAEELARTDLTDIYRFHAVSDGGTVRIGPFEVTSRRVAHPCEAYGFRITTPEASLAYTGDTGPCEALHELADGVDVLLSEATWEHAEDRPADLHMSGRQAGRLAAAAGVGRLLLTHVAPWTDARVVLAEAREEFDGPVEPAARGKSYRIG